MNNLITSAIRYLRMLRNRINEKPYWYNDAYFFPTNYQKRESNNVSNLYRQPFTIPVYWKIIYNEITCGGRVTYTVAANRANYMQIILEVRQEESIALIEAYVKSYYQELPDQKSSFLIDIQEEYPWTKFRYFTIHFINDVESVNHLRILFNTTKQNRLTISKNKNWFKLDFVELYKPRSFRSKSSKMPI